MSPPAGTSPGRVHAVCVDAPGHSKLTEITMGRPAAGEVLVRVAAAGICGSDVELFAGTRPAGYVSYPVVPGHEWAGIVLAVGAGVDHVAPGAPVVAEGFRWCGVCARCRQGQTTLCLAGYAETGFTDSGAFAETLIVPARLVHRLPGGADQELAALLEPAACVAAGLLEAPQPAGSSVAVVGAGTLGLLAVQMLALHRPRDILVIDPRDDRLEVAAELGATHTVRAGGGSPDELPSGLAGGADLVVESAGSPGAAACALGLVRRGGHVVLTGIAGSDEPALSPDAIALGALHVHGVFGAHSRAWQHAVALFAAGALRLGPLVSHRLPLSRYREALDLIANPDSGTRKVLLLPGENATQL